MKCLFVKAPFAGWIVDGVKTIEFRTRETYIRGRIGIIESGTGTVIGDVVLYTCRKSFEYPCFNWILDRPRRYKTPGPFEHKQGAMVWIDLDIDPTVQEIAPALPWQQLFRETALCRKAQEEFLETLKNKRKSK